VSHLTDEEADLFVAGLLEPPACRQAVRHLLAGCQECQTKLEGHVELAMLLENNPSSGLFDDGVYDEPIDRATAVALNELPRWEEEKEELERLLETVRTLPEGILGLPESEKFSGWPFVEGLLAESQEARFRDPERMRFLAFAATVSARNLDRQRYREGTIADLCARAWAELSNAYRLDHDFEAAEDALARAETYIEQGTGDPLILARLLDLEASLRSSQRRLPETLELLDHVYRIYLQVGENHLAGRALISKGINTAYDDRPAEALRHLRDGLSLINPESDPRLAAIGRYELVHSLVDCGEFRQAGQALLESGLRDSFAQDPLNLARLRWLEGKIHAGLGKLWRADQVLAEVRKGFLERGQDYDAALVGLDLAAVWLQQGNNAAVRELAEEILETFAALRIQREGLKAVRFFREACRREMATPALVQKVAGFLRRLEWQPQLRFAP
jgi:tetratricopeptide (TPR) repeat protein